MKPRSGDSHRVCVFRRCGGTIDNIGIYPWRGVCTVVRLLRRRSAWCEDEPRQASVRVVLGRRASVFETIGRVNIGDQVRVPPTRRAASAWPSRREHERARHPVRPSDYHPGEDPRTAHTPNRVTRRGDNQQGDLPTSKQVHVCKQTQNIDPMTTRRRGTASTPPRRAARDCLPTSTRLTVRWSKAVGPLKTGWATKTARVRRHVPGWSR